MAHNGTVLAQFPALVPRHELETLAKRHLKGRMLRSMMRWSQFVAMAVAQLAGRSSLRDIVSNLSAQGRKLYRLGVGVVARSSLARVNEEQPHGLCEELFGRVPARCRTSAPGTASGSATRSTRWTRRWSTCACRCSPGRGSSRPRGR